MRTILLASLLALSVTACGYLDRLGAAATGYTRACVDGVQYLQFMSGVTPAFNPDGSLKTCS